VCLLILHEFLLALKKNANLLLGEPGADTLHVDERRGRTVTISTPVEEVAFPKETLVGARLAWNTDVISAPVIERSDL